MSAAAVIAIHRKRLIRRFREAGATDLLHATTPEALGQRQSWIFNRMVDAGVFVPTPDSRYFLDEQAADEYLHRQRVRALAISAILLIVFLILWVCGLVGR